MVRRSLSFAVIGSTALAVLSLATSLQAVAAQAGLSAEQIDRLIVLGKANRLKDVANYTCTAKRTTGGMLGGGLLPMAISAGMNAGKTSYGVTMMSNHWLIASAARNATLKNQQFTRSDVPVEWLAAGLYVAVSAELPDPKETGTPIIPEPVSEVIFRSALRKRVLFTLGTPREEARTWRNAAGATVDYKDLMFTVDHAGLASAEKQRKSDEDARRPDEVSDYGTNFVLVTPSGVRTCFGVSIKNIIGLVTAKIK